MVISTSRIGAVAAIAASLLVVGGVATALAMSSAATAQQPGRPLDLAPISVDAGAGPTDGPDPSASPSTTQVPAPPPVDVDDHGGQNGGGGGNDDGGNGGGDSGGGNGSSGGSGHG